MADSEDETRDLKDVQDEPLACYVIELRKTGRYMILSAEGNQDELDLDVGEDDRPSVHGKRACTSRSLLR